MYTQLTKEQQMETLRQAILQLESQHYAHVLERDLQLDVLASPDVTPPLKARAQKALNDALPEIEIREIGIRNANEKIVLLTTEGGQIIEEEQVKKARSRKG